MNSKEQQIAEIEKVKESVLNKYRNSITRKAFLEAVSEIEKIVSGDR